MDESTFKTSKAGALEKEMLSVAKCLYSDVVSECSIGR